jgi:hypothetical protein
MCTRSLSRDAATRRTFGLPSVAICSPAARCNTTKLSQPHHGTQKPMQTHPNCSSLGRSVAAIPHTFGLPSVVICSPAAFCSALQTTQLSHRGTRQLMPIHPTAAARALIPHTCCLPSAVILSLAALTNAMQTTQSPNRYTTDDAKQLPLSTPSACHLL